MEYNGVDLDAMGPQEMRDALESAIRTMAVEREIAQDTQKRLNDLDVILGSVFSNLAGFRREAEPIDEAVRRLVAAKDAALTANVELLRQEGELKKAHNRLALAEAEHAQEIEKLNRLICDMDGAQERELWRTTFVAVSQGLAACPIELVDYPATAIQQASTTADAAVKLYRAKYPAGA